MNVVFAIDDGQEQEMLPVIGCQEYCERQPSNDVDPRLRQTLTEHTHSVTQT